MAHPSFRFAHAGHLRLDLPLRGVGPLSEAARRMAEDAPAAAWERVVEACIDQDVEFLLLTPRTIARTSSPMDRRHLLAGFRQLDEFGIRVYWALAADEASADLRPHAWPENVTLLTKAGETESLIRDGHALATFRLGPVAMAERPTHASGAAETSGPRPLRIAIPTDAAVLDRIPSPGGHGALSCGAAIGADGECDYVAGWGSSRSHSHKTAAGVWLDPGSPQGRAADEPGVGGVSIVEWDGGRISGVQRAPTSPVRWECCQLATAPETTREELLEQMQYALLEREPAWQGEQLWIVDWHVSGTGPLFDALQAEPTRRELEAAVAGTEDGPEPNSQIHRWELRARGEAANGDVGRQLLEWLERRSDSEWTLASRDLESELRAGEFTAAADCLPLIGHVEAHEEAERQLEAWFSRAVREAV